VGCAGLAVVAPLPAADQTQADVVAGLAYPLAVDEAALLEQGFYRFGGIVAVDVPLQLGHFSLNISLEDLLLIHLTAKEFTR
jgi:hypothetical protein